MNQVSDQPRAGVLDDLELYLGLYGQMLLIRGFEDLVQSLFLAGEVYGTTHLYSGQDELRQVCDRAASLSKADLLTGIVGEFPELQGIMGGEYARHDGESTAVAQAIREQYLPKAIEGELPKTLAGQILSLADRLDSIAAFFHVGIVPSF